MKKNIKSKLYLLIVFTILFTSFFIRHKITNYKNKEITHAVEHYLTKGFFNFNKLCGVDTIHLKFSDGKVAVLEASGLQEKSPHKKVTYKIFLEKTSKGIWKVKKLYQIP